MACFWYPKKTITLLIPKASVGVTTGPTFCGVVGSSLRREYTVMGMLVNLAARLMCAAPVNGVLVDERTQSQFDVDDVDLDEDYERSSNSQLNTRNQTGELNHK